MNVVFVADEFFTCRAQFIEVRDRKCAMNIEFTEAATFRAFEVLQNDRYLSWEVGGVSTAQEITPLITSEGMPTAEEGEKFTPGEIL